MFPTWNITGIDGHTFSHADHPTNLIDLVKANAPDAVFFTFGTDHLHIPTYL